jgi:hypothetical protein
VAILIQIVLYEVFDVRSSLDRQAEVSEDVRDRLEQSDVLDVLDGRGEVLVVRDDRQRIAFHRGRLQDFEDEGVRKLILLDIVTEQTGLTGVGLEDDRRLDTIDRDGLSSQRLEHLLHRDLVFLQQLSVQVCRRYLRQFDPEDLVG